MSIKLILPITGNIININYYEGITAECSLSFLPETLRQLAPQYFDKNKKFDGQLSIIMLRNNKSLLPNDLLFRDDFIVVCIR